MLFDNRTQALRRALAGGLVGVAAHLLLGYLLGSISLFGPARFRGFVFPNCNFRFQPEWLGVLVSFALFALFGAELGIATLPFAGTGRALVKRTLAHFLTMAATVALWAGLNAGAEGVALLLALLAVFYALIWLGRWVGWYAEVAAIREKLGAEDNGSSLCPWLNDLKQVVRLLIRHRSEQEFINDQQVGFLVRADHFQVSAFSPRDSQPVQQVRDPDIPDGKTVPARGNTQGMGKICFPAAGCPHDDDMAAVADVAAA